MTFGDGGTGGGPSSVDAGLVRRLRREDERYVVCDGEAVTELALRSYARPSEWPADEDAAAAGGAAGRVDSDNGDDDVEVRGRGLGDDDDGDGDVVNGNISNTYTTNSTISSSSSSWRATIGPYPSIRKLGYVCPLFARKFAPQAASQLAAALAEARALRVPRLDLSRAGPAPPSPNLAIKTEAWAEEDGGGGRK